MKKYAGAEDGFYIPKLSLRVRIVSNRKKKKRQQLDTVKNRFYIRYTCIRHEFYKFVKEYKLKRATSYYQKYKMLLLRILWIKSWGKILNAKPRQRFRNVNDSGVGKYERKKHSLKKSQAFRAFSKHKN
jgi:hypothetical protein